VTGNAFDSQEGAAALAIGTSVGSASAFTTAVLTSGNVLGGLGGSWTYAAGYYPQVSALVSNANSLVRAISALGSVPVLFGSDTDTSTGVTAMLKFPQTIGAAPVRWLASPSVLELHDIGDGYWYSGWTTPGNVTLTASAGGVSKKFTFYLTGTLTLREVHFDPGYVGGTPPSPLVAADGSTISEPTVPTRAGYALAGWFTEAACVNQWDFAADVVTADTTLYAKWTLAVPNAVESVKTGRFPLTLPPGRSFDVRVRFETEDGAQPFPTPVLSVGLDSDGTSLVSADVVSPDHIVIAAFSRTYDTTRRAGGSAVYGGAVITVTATQTLSDGSTLQSRASRSLIIGEELLTGIAMSDDILDVFQQANDELVPSDVTILPGNTQPPLTGNGAWYLVGALDNADIVILPPDGNHLPECFEPAGKDAASITIDLANTNPPSRNAKGLVPLTYIATTRRAELESSFGAAVTSAILSSPLEHLNEIFAEMVIQKEIRQGQRTGWFTRLVDGVLSPRQAIDAGILEITGGDSLTMTLSYYVLDDSTLEAFMYDGYLIVPDGANDGVIADPIWFNKWREGYAPGANSLAGRSSGGGGCAGGGTPAVLPIVLAIAALVSAVKRRN
jgi:uncharacterized repeat protein (TIGR02543 family)